MKCLVIGDSCIDRFIYCDINRLCPEAPVPVLKPVSQTENPGMAGNVVANLESLAETDVTVITNTSPIIKTRYVDDKSGQMIMRFDENDYTGKCKVNFQEYFEHYVFDAVIISDYNKGFLTEDTIKNIAKMSNCPTFLDTKKKLGKWCYNIDFIKINEYEWNNNKDYESDNIIVTRGADGASYNNSIFKPKREVMVSNVSGAGDTFMAGLVYSYVNTRSIENSIRFANECASHVVQQRGVVSL